MVPPFDGFMNLDRKLRSEIRVLFWQGMNPTEAFYLKHATVGRTRPLVRESYLTVLNGLVLEVTGCHLVTSLSKRTAAVAPIKAPFAA